MQLRYREIEPALARQVWERQRSAARAQASATGPVQTREPAWSAFSLASAIFVVGLYFLLFFRMGSVAVVLALLLVPAVLLGVLLLPNYLAELGPQGWVPPTAVRSWLADEPLTRAQQLYGETVLLMLETPALRRTPARQLLREVNGLVVDDQHLALHQERLRQIADPNALLATEAERGALTQRRDATDDPIARATLNESLALCTERLEHLRELPQTLVRLDAHRELICQALALAHASLLRSRATPLALHPPDLTSLKESVRQLSSETRALEETARTLVGPE